MGHRDPSAPSFVFFDDDRALDPDIAWGRDLALDFEEYVARRNHECSDERICHPARHDKLSGYRPVTLLDYCPIDAPTQKGMTRHKQGKRKVVFHGVTTRPMIHNKTRKDFIFIEVSEPVVVSQIEDMPQDFEYALDEESQAYFERQESRRFANWIVDFAKRRPSDNDRWRKLMIPLASRLGEDDPLTPVARQILRTMKEALPFAPGPARGTLFVNPDGSKFHSASNNFGSAKASFIKRHGLTDEFVSVDRVQKEGERHSTYVVGIRKTSDSVPSNYFDPNPSWMEKKRDGTWIKAYNPCACNLYRVPASMVMPGGSHRLSVREFEQAVIAGADTLDSIDELIARQFEQDPMPDTRVMLLNMGDGCDGRDPSALTHEETYLYNVLRMFGEEQACQLMLLENQEPGLLHTHFMSHGQYGQVVVNILRFVAKDPEAAEDGVLPFVISALTNRPQDEIESRMDLKSRSRDNKRVLSKDWAPCDYGFTACVAEDAYTETEDDDTAEAG